jgi:hypothetical protein
MSGFTPCPSLMDNQENWTDAQNPQNCAANPNSLQPRIFALGAYELFDRLGKIGERVHRVGIPPDPLDDLLNVIFLWFRKFGAHSFFLDGLNEFPKPHCLFPATDKFVDKLCSPFVLLRDAPFLFFSLPLLFPSAMFFLTLLPVFLMAAAATVSPTMKSPRQSSIRCCLLSAHVRRIGPMKGGKLAICN